MNAIINARYGIGDFGTLATPKNSDDIKMFRIATGRLRIVLGEINGYSFPIEIFLKDDNSYKRSEKQRRPYLDRVREAYNTWREEQELIY